MKRSIMAISIIFTIASMFIMFLVDIDVIKSLAEGATIIFSLVVISLVCLEIIDAGENWYLNDKEDEE